MGLSSLDLSVMQRDPYLFHLVCSSKQRRINIDACDEEGFTVIHRLSADEDRITRLGNVFSSAPFKGTREKVRQGLREIVEIVRELDGNFDLFTTTTKSKTQHSRPSDMLDQTPLMLAMRRVDVDVVKALLDNGANPNIENEDGATAIHYLGSNTEEAKVQCVQLLASHKANLNHRSKSGATLITRGGLSPGVVDALLSNGVSIEMVNSTTKAFENGQSLWMLLAAHDEPSPYVQDREVAKLLEKHVFRLQDTEKIRKVIDYADQDGFTMLHKYVGRGMFFSVEALLQNGAQTNKMFCEKSHEWEGKVRVNFTRYLTPLDVAFKAAARREEDAKFSSEKYTRAQYDEYCERNNAIIKALEKFKGVRSAIPEVVSRVEFTK
ncbi:hypothetical protein N0V90_000585 [Kalmusia sp. IMI 367209]|nr:hypothetical protein N0V90_000585 [Kalmusia sp. IMI 367209]